MVKEVCRRNELQNFCNNAKKCSTSLIYLPSWSSWLAAVLGMTTFMTIIVMDWVTIWCAVYGCSTNLPLLHFFQNIFPLLTTKLKDKTRRVLSYIYTCVFFTWFQEKLERTLSKLDSEVADLNSKLNTLSDEVATKWQKLFNFFSHYLTLLTSHVRDLNFGPCHFIHILFCNK